MHYFISKGGDKKGPLTLDQIKAMSITEDYIIWKEGLSDWVSVKDVPELQELIVRQPPPTPREVEAIQRNDELRLAIKKVLPVFISIYVIFLIIFYSAIGGLTPSDSVLEYLRNQAYPIYYATPGEAYLGLFFIAIFWSLIFSSIASGLYWFASYKPNKKTEFISGSEQGKSINNPYDKIDAQVSGTESQSSNNSDINAIDHKRNNIGKSGIIAAIFLFISIIISAISGYQRENNSTPEAPAEVPAAAPTEETISYEQAIPIDSLQNNSITSSNDLDEREYLIKNLDGVPEKELIQQIDEQIKEKNISTIKDYKEYILSLASKFSNYTVPVINKSTNVTLSLNNNTRKYRTRFRDAFTGDVNFAGHFIATIWGCGTMAFAGGYIDLTTGNTYFFPSPMNGSSYYNSKGSVATFLPQIYADKRSSLIVLLGSREFSEVDGLDDYGLHYYQMKGDKMVYIKSILLKDALRGSGSKM